MEKRPPFTPGSMDVERTVTCRCGAAFKTTSRVAKHCPSCRPVVVAMRQAKANAKYAARIKQAKASA